MYIAAPDFTSTELGIQSSQWSLDRPADVSVSRYAGVRSVVAAPWHAKWSAHIELAPIEQQTNIRAIRSFLARCLGSVNTFRMPATEGAQNDNYGVTVAASVKAGARQIVISGAVTPLDEGQFFTVNGQLCCLTADQTANTLYFEPPLREDAAAGTTVVTSRPYALVCMSQQQLGWSISPGAVYGIAFDVEEAIGEADGAFAPEIVAALPTGPIVLPTVFNNTLGLKPWWDGSQVQVQDPYDLIDFTLSGPVTDYYWSWATGNDANAGTSAAAPFQTMAHAFATMVSPARLNLLDDYVGSGAYPAGFTLQFTGKLKVVGKNGRTIWHTRREVETAATWAFTLSAGTCYVTSAARAANIWRAMLDGNFRDANGIPTPLAAAASIAACQATKGTMFWDSTNSRLYVNMVDGRAPDPDDGWLIGEATTFVIFQLDETANGVILFENCEFFYNSGSAGLSSFTSRPNPTGTTFCRLGRKNCLFYGSSGNGSSVLDYGITASVDCVAAYNHIDGFNYHKFGGGDGSVMTFYELNCKAYNNGYTGFLDQGADSTSANGTTSHDSIHSLRMNGVYENSNGAVVADVNGTLSVLLYCGSLNPTGTANPKACFWASGVGVGANHGTYLWGCYANDNGDPSVILLDSSGAANAEADGQFYVQHWRGQTVAANDVGPALKDWNGNVLASLAAAA